MAKLKPYVRSLIFGAIIFFFLKIVKDYWTDLTSIKITTTGWGLLMIAFFVTFTAHLWSAYVWFWMLKAFGQPVKPKWAIQVYLITNMAKYLPGNIWHFYGRIRAVTQAGSNLAPATVSVLLEPLLMAAAGLIIAIISSCLGWINTSSNTWLIPLQFLGLAVVLIGIHPFFLNPVVRLLNRMKTSQKLENKEISSEDLNKIILPKTKNTEKVGIDRYPILPLLGELGFVGLRATGFLFGVMAFFPVTVEILPNLISVFSLAWVFGLIIPGAPGGLGVFEATAIAFLDKNYFSPGIVLAMVALFRLVSITAEAFAATLAYLTGGKLTQN